MRFLTFAIIFALGACAQPVTGGPAGGVMPWITTSTQMSFSAAQAHCAKYGKDARIQQIVPQAGGTVAFDCVN